MRTTVILLTCMLSGVAMAQESLTLFDCQRMAREHAPRLEDVEVIQQMGETKIDQAGTSWYPSLDLNGKLSYQSDVVTVVLTDPSIPVAFPEVPHDQYGLNLDISQILYDGGISRGKRSYEEVLMAADLQQVEVDLYRLKEKVNHLYFAVLVLKENRQNLEIHLENLQARYKAVQTAVTHGSLLETELHVIEVEKLKVMNSMIEVDSRKQSYMGALRVLCGEGVDKSAILEKPQFEGIEAAGMDRPEQRLFDLKHASMEAGKELAGKKRMPVLYAFGQTGYGKPGYNMLSEEWDYYYMVGAGLRWKIWDWNNTSREKQVIGYQQQILQNQRASFDREIESLMVQEEARIEQYRKTMEMDQQVLELQKKISGQAAVRLDNGTMTATDYVTELNKESLARITLATHQVMLMQSMANYLTIQGNL
ncbi:MAG: TolC family protein [Bacteroidales bacterium]|nr:TolC family protein [Bacteroidales bacterium]